MPFVVNKDNDRLDVQIATSAGIVTLASWHHLVENRTYPTIQELVKALNQSMIKQHDVTKGATAEGKPWASWAVKSSSSVELRITPNATPFWGMTHNVKSGLFRETQLTVSAKKPAVANLANLIISRNFNNPGGFSVNRQVGEDTYMFRTGCPDGYIHTKHWDHGGSIFPQAYCMQQIPDNQCFRVTSDKTVRWPSSENSLYPSCAYPPDYVQSSEDLDEIAARRRSDCSMVQGSAPNHKYGMECFDDQTFNNFARNWCQGVDDEGKPRIVSDPNCGDWCKNEPEVCMQVKRKFCKDNPDHPLCRCMNASRDSVYQKIKAIFQRKQSQGKMAILPKDSCWWGPCTQQDLDGTLIPLDMLNDKTPCPDIQLCEAGDVNISGLSVTERGKLNVQGADLSCFDNHADPPTKPASTLTPGAKPPTKPASTLTPGAKPASGAKPPAPRSEPNAAWIVAVLIAIVLSGYLLSRR